VDQSSGNDLNSRATAIVVASITMLVMTIAGISMSRAADPAAGKLVFEARCHSCHAALPYIGRIGEANLPAFLANPRRYNPQTAMTSPGLRRRKDIEDVIAYITGAH
jgi:cytochrome c2